MIPIGTKVVPISKSVGDRHFPCSIWGDALKRGQSYLYVKYFDEKSETYTLNMTGDVELGGNYYKETDLITYVDILNEGDEL